MKTPEEALDEYLREHLSIHIKGNMGSFGSGADITIELKLKDETISQDWLDVSDLVDLMRD